MRDAQASVHIVAASVGFVSFGLLWFTVLWGIALRAGWALTRIRHHTLYGTHQTLTLVGLTLGVVHALAQLAAPGGSVTMVDEWLPFTNDADPIGVGLGVIALELMLALAVSVLIQKRLGYHRWRRLHLFAYVAFTALTAHLLISGSEVEGWVAVVVTLAWLLTVLLWLAGSPWAAALPRAMAERIRSRLQGRSVTVNVDPSRCVRFGFCEHEAPELFHLHSDGRLVYRPSVPADRVESAISAARVCPARAIMLSRSATEVMMPATRRDEGGHDRGQTLRSPSGLHATLRPRQGERKPDAGRQEPPHTGTQSHEPPRSGTGQHRVPQGRVRSIRRD